MSKLAPGLVLGLDLSPKVGWALGRPGDAPRWGMRELPKEDGLGACCATFEDWLDEFLENERPDLISYEAPLAPDLQGSRETCEYNYGLPFAARGCAFRAQIEIVSHSIDTLRGAVIGRTRLTEDEKRVRPRLTVKKAIIEPWVRSMGWSIGDDNARDAAVVWGYEVGMRHEMFGRKRRPA